MKEQVGKLVFLVPFIDHGVMDITTQDCFFKPRLQEILGFILLFCEAKLLKAKVRNSCVGLENQAKMKESCSFLVYPRYFLFAFDFFFLV